MSAEAAELVTVRAPVAIIAVVALSALAASVPVTSRASATATPNPFTSVGARHATVLVVPLDPRAERLLGDTIPLVARWLRWRVHMTAIPTPSDQWVNTKRRQLDSRAVMADLLARFRRVNGDRVAFVVPVTSVSMYDPMFPAFRFVFGSRGRVPDEVNGVQAIAMIGTREMRVFHPSREKARLTKMMLRYVGEMVCSLPRVANPRSVLYEPILSDADLDAMVARPPRRC